MKAEFEGYVVASKSLEGFMDYIPCTWESQDIDDSYYAQRTPLYEKPFEGGKKIRVTVEVIDE